MRYAVEVSRDAAIGSGDEVLPMGDCAAEMHQAVRKWLRKEMGKGW